MKYKIVLIALLFFSFLSHANQNQALTKFYGTWTLVSIKQVEGFKKEEDDPIYGKHPKGYLMYMPDGHMMVFIATDKRNNPQSNTTTPEEAVALLNTMTSYAGTYQIKGNQVIHHIEVSWNQSWAETEQKRTYKFDEDYLILSMPPFLNAKNEKITLILKWKKIK